MVEKSPTGCQLPLRPCTECDRDSDFGFVLHVTDCSVKGLSCCICADVSFPPWKSECGLQSGKSTLSPPDLCQIYVFDRSSILRSSGPWIWKIGMDKDARHLMNDSGGRKSWPISAWWSHWGANWQQVHVWCSWSGQLSNSGHYTARNSEGGKFSAYTCFFSVCIFNVILKKG